MVVQINAVVYVGDGRSREVIRTFEFEGSQSQRGRPYGFEVGRGVGVAVAVKPHQGLPHQMQLTPLLLCSMCNLRVLCYLCLVMRSTVKLAGALPDPVAAVLSCCLVVQPAVVQCVLSILPVTGTMAC
jgi:hypothetical protein